MVHIGTDKCMAVASFLADAWTGDCRFAVATSTDGIRIGAVSAIPGRTDVKKVI